jgi:hypothetical protein
MYWSERSTKRKGPKGANEKRWLMADQVASSMPIKWLQACPSSGSKHAQQVASPSAEAKYDCFAGAALQGDRCMMAV